MKLFDYDSHASQSAKRLSNPNISAKLKIKGSDGVLFKKAKLNFYLIDEINGVEKIFNDAVDSFQSIQKLKILNATINENIANFFNLFSVTFNENNWISENNDLILNYQFSEIEIIVKKCSDVFENQHLFIESTLTNLNNVESTIWSKIIIRPESYEIGPGIFLSYNIE